VASVPTVGGLDKMLAIAAAVLGFAAIISVVYLLAFLPS
jgi:hypothetical protein